jgi:hypothetical protein
MVNKRAWVKLLEAFLAVSLIIVILSVNIYTIDKKNKDIKDQIQEKEFEILNIIQNNESLRESILNVSTIPVESNENGFPDNLKIFWNKTMINSIECILKICSPENICESVNYPSKKEIYVQSIIISSTKEKYSPLKIVSFCWGGG